MELAFQSKPFHFLRHVMQETRFQEETAEIIVPDSYPDIASITDCCAEVILRGKDCRDGSVTVAGGVKGVILYAPEDGTYPRNLETYIPFSVKFDDSHLTAHAQVLCSIRVRSADARMINSRKALLRVNIGCEINVYEQATDTQYVLEDRPPELQTKEAVYTAGIPLETGEKSFVISDSIELSPGQPTATHIYEFHCVPELTDEKLVGNKAVFKGNIHYRMLYMAEDERLRLHEQTVPFSQYCELGNDYDEETVITQFMITGYDLEPPANNEGQQMLITINMLAQCVVYGKQTLSLIEDAYSIRGTLSPQWKEYAFECGLDHQKFAANVRVHIPGELREVLDTRVYWDYPDVTQGSDRAQTKIPLMIRVLGYDESGNLMAFTGKTEAVQELAVSDDAACKAAVSQVGDVYASPVAGGIEARCTAQLSMRCCSRQRLRTLSGGEIETDDQTDKNRPTLIVRTVEKDTSLWNLAKTYGTTVDQIAAANHLSDTVLGEDTMLLLPLA